MFSLFVVDTVQRHRNNSEENFFFKNDPFLGKHLPIIEELKKKLEDGDDTYIQMLRYHARNIKGSDNFWREQTSELETWISHHIACGRGPPTHFIIFHMLNIGDRTCAAFWGKWSGTQATMEKLIF